MEKRNRFKKIYIEISNICNLDCFFCAKTNREKRSLTIDEFKLILNKIKPFTKYLYFHVLGEPLLHKNINEFINIAHQEGFYINITTNGYLINNLKSNNVRQINISLHSFNDKYNKPLDEYLSDIYKFIDNNKDTYINFRIWAFNPNSNIIIKSLEERFNINISIGTHTKLDNNIYLDFDNEFLWPDESNELVSTNYSCHALKDHIAILSDGTVTACCLDASGKINLGNIFKEELNDVLNKDLFKKMLEGFNNNQRIHPLCQRCNFIEIKNKKVI